MGRRYFLLHSPKSTYPLVIDAFCWKNFTVGIVLWFFARAFLAFTVLLIAALFGVTRFWSVDTVPTTISKTFSVVLGTFHIITTIWGITTIWRIRVALTVGFVAYFAIVALFWSATQEPSSQTAESGSSQFSVH
jgi:hypothetical protein